MAPIKGCPRGNYNTQSLKPPERVFCFYCNKGYKRRAILEHHMKTKHLNYRVSCSVCEKKFTSKSVLNRHMANVHSIKSYGQIKVDLVPIHKQHASSINEPKSNVKRFEPFLNMSFESYKAFPSLANVIMMKKDEIFGVHLVANRDIDVGKVIVVSSAFASVECLSSIDSCCFQCGKSNNTNFIKCSYCINTFFCSKKCSLSKIHASKCNKMFSSSDSYIVRLTTETIKNAFEKANDTNTFIEFIKGVLFRKIKHNNCQPPYSTYGEILNLKGSKENDHATMTHRVVQCLMSLPKINCCQKPDLKRVLFLIACRHIASMKINSFSEEIPVSKGVCTRYSVHDVLSRVNHSCVPNIHHYYDSENITRCVTVRPIKKGDQIFMNYLGEMKFNDEVSRKSYIQELWSFSCECDMCRQVIHASQPDPSYDFIKYNFNQGKNIDPQNSNRLIEECKNYLNKFGHYWSNAIDFVVFCFIFIIHNI